MTKSRVFTNCFFGSRLKVKQQLFHPDSHTFSPAYNTFIHGSFTLIVWKSVEGVWMNSKRVESSLAAEPE
jgi:hypothetical protein